MTVSPVPPLPSMGLGTWQWGDRNLWGYGGAYSDADVRSAFEASVQAGVTFFDTAEVYGSGESERLLGACIRASGRNDIRVATKFFPYPWRLTRDSPRSALYGSLQRLNLPTVELYQVHGPFLPRSTEWLMDSLADLVDAGLTRSVGVSNYSVSTMRRAHAALAAWGIPLRSNQISFSLLERGPERNGMVAACRELGVELIAYSPLGMGLLAGKYTPTNPPPGWRRVRLGRQLGRIQPLIALLRELGERHGGKSPAQVALNWVICKGAIPIPGAKNAEQARQNAGALDWRLADDEVAALDRLAP